MMIHQSIIFSFLHLGALFSFTTAEPVTWKYEVIKTGEKQFEIKFVASISDGWHIYAMKQGENFIGKATSIRIDPHPLIAVQGQPKEIGKLIRTKEEEMGIETREFRNKVEYTQKIILKSSSRTTMSGEIVFQSCTDETCLPPSRFDFTIVLNER